MKVGIHSKTCSVDRKSHGAFAKKKSRPKIRSKKKLEHFSEKKYPPPQSGISFCQRISNYTNMQTSQKHDFSEFFGFSAGRLLHPRAAQWEFRDATSWGYTWDTINNNKTFFPKMTNFSMKNIFRTILKNRKFQKVTFSIFFFNIFFIDNLNIDQPRFQ